MHIMIHMIYSAMIYLHHPIFLVLW